MKYIAEVVDSCLCRIKFFSDLLFFVPSPFSDDLCINRKKERREKDGMELSLIGLKCHVIQPF